MSALLKACQAESGIIAAVGAGGKKSTLHRLIEDHPGSVALTNTVHTRPAPDSLALATIIAAEDELQRRVIAYRQDYKRITYSHPGDESDRHAGVAAGLIESLHHLCRFDATFVKADGARMRWIKAPREGEPVLPSGCTTVLAVVSALALGRPLGDDIAHRLEALERVMAARRGDLITTDHLARLMTHADGLLRGTSGTTVIPIINMVDDDVLHELARRVAEQAFDLADRFDRVVLARMNDRDRPVVEILWRNP